MIENEHPSFPFPCGLPLFVFFFYLMRISAGTTCFTFLRVNQVHDHNTRLSLGLSYSILKPRTNYSKYNIWFQGPRIWNSFDIMLKTSSLT